MMLLEIEEEVVKQKLLQNNNIDSDLTTSLMAFASVLVFIKGV